MINEEDINKINEACKAENRNVRIRDIAFVALCRELSSREIAYRVIFGGDEKEYQEYASSPDVKFLESYLEVNYFGSNNSDNTTQSMLSFEENKREMENLLRQTQVELDNGTIEPKDALKIMADIRVKLNDKFNVQESATDQTVVVNCKYNHVCERFGCECYLPTEEDLIKRYGLVKPNKINL